MSKEDKKHPNPQAGAAEEAEKNDAGTHVAGGEDSAASAAPAPELPKELATAYQNLLGEKQALYDRLLRKQAELENLRKRVQRDKEDFLQHATADVVRALLPVLDGFERALKHRDPNVPEHFYQGMELIHRQLLDILHRAGLSPIETAGKVFDPHLHQAVETVEAPGTRDQEIVEELQRGYTFKQRLLRPATVRVAVGSPKESPEHDSKHTAPVK